MSRQRIWVRSGGSIKTMIESFEALTWTRRYRTLGALRLRVNRKVDGAEFLVNALGDEISINDDPEATQPDLTFVIEELNLRGGGRGAVDDVIELVATEAGLFNFRVALPPPHHGPFGNVVNFDGVDAVMDAAQVFDGVGDFTVEVWFKAPSSSTSMTMVGEVEDDTDTIQAEFFNCALRGDLGGVLRIGLNDGTNGDTLDTVSAYDDDEWHHASFQRDGSTLRINVDFDAEIVSKTTTATGDVANATSRFRIGAVVSNGQWFDGDIAEVRVWDDVRTQDEIRDNRFKRLQGDEANLVGYYRMDDGAGSVVADSLVGGTNDGTLSGGFTWSTFGPSHHSQLGVDAETAMRELVNVNVGAGAIPERQFPNLILATNQNRGVVRDWLARFGTVAEKLRAWSELADDIGWEVQFDAAANQHVFTVLQGSDVSAKVQFSIALDNVQSTEWIRAGQDQASLAYVAGQDEGGARQFNSAWDGALPQGKNRREIFIDARDLEAITDLAPRGDEKLAERAIDENFEVEISPISPFQYKRDWDLGDVVTLKSDPWGITKTKRIVEIEQTLNANDGAVRRRLVFGKPLKDLRARVQDLVGDQATARQ